MGNENDIYSGMEGSNKKKRFMHDIHSNLIILPCRCLFFISPLFLRQRMHAELSTAALLINFAHPSYQAPVTVEVSIFATIINLERSGDQFLKQQDCTTVL